MDDWLIYSIFVLIITAFLTLIIKYLGTILNNFEEIKLFICISLIIAGIFSLIYLVYNNNFYMKHLKNIKENKTDNNILIFILIIFGLLLLLNFIFQGLAHNKCKIPGLPLIIVNMNIIIVLLISSILFDIKINRKIILGIIVALIGLSIVIVNS